ncbi:putative secreted protein [Streptococcus dysgalactiae subsp. equisimilis]|nr:putative secreted protein [Streptococcus dysgalactiae subsp. equisimilis]
MRIKKSLVILLALCTFSLLTYSLSLNVQASDLHFGTKTDKLKRLPRNFKKESKF